MNHTRRRKYFSSFDLLRTEPEVLATMPRGGYGWALYNMQAKSILKKSTEERRMKRPFCFIITISTLVFGLQTQPRLFGNSDPQMQTVIDEAATKALAAFHVPGVAIGVVQGDTVLMTKGYGLRDVDKNLPVTEKTLFAIGSCTKAFTAFVISQLEEEGKLSWDDLLMTYLPEFAAHDTLITSRLKLRDLASHRSGLPRNDYVWGLSERSRHDVLQRASALPFSEQLYGRFQYNNLMYVVLGTVIERVTHHTWEEEVRERILTPLGMNSTNFLVDDSQRSDDFSLPYTEKKSATFATAFHQMASVGPAGSINSSVSDMVHWLRLNLSNGTVSGQHFLQNRALKELHTIQTPLTVYPEDTSFEFGYGLGWSTGIYKGHYCLMHQGGIDGFSSVVVLLPHDHLGVVILTNSDVKGSAVTTCVSRTIVDKALGLESEDWIAKIQEQVSQCESEKETCHAMASDGLIEGGEYVGAYSNSAYGSVTVYEEGKELHASYDPLDFALHRVKSDAFVGSVSSGVFAGTTTQIAFPRNLFGDVIGVRIPLDATSDPIVFSKLPSQELTTPTYLHQYVGTYGGCDTSVETFFRGTDLMVCLEGMPPAKLFPIQPNVFDVEHHEGYRLTFEPETAALTKTLNVSTPGGQIRLQRR
jgi:CubicO group peptidase (beta-lactamase class C family)